MLGNCIMRGRASISNHQCLFPESGTCVIYSSNRIRRIMKQPECREGPKALKDFERLATALFRVPKAGGRKKPEKSSRNASVRKSKPSDKD